MYKGHRNIATEKVVFKYTSNEFKKEFLENVDEATQKFLDKTIQLSGEVTEIEADNFTLNNSIICYSDSLSLKKIKLLSQVTVKGRSIGYDDLLEYIKLDQVLIINP